MKIYTIIIICFFSISYLWAEEYKNISYDWSQIVLPKNDKPLMSLITEKNELFIVSDSCLYYSNDFGKSLKQIPGGYGAIQIYGYQYDNDNGLYLMVDDERGVYFLVDLYYLNPDRDSLKAISHLYKKYFDEHVSLYYTLFTDIISNQYLIIGTQIEVWLYDIVNKKYSPIKYIDDLIQDLIKKDSVNQFKINLVNVDKLSNRIDIYYSIGTPGYHIYSNDLGKTWKNDLFKRECIPYPDDIILGYAQWNKKDRWYLPNAFNKSISSIDNNCNVFYKEFSAVVSAGKDWVSPQSRFYAVDSLVIIPTFDNKGILFSKDYGHNYNMIDNLPFEVEIYQFVGTLAFTDAKVLILTRKNNFTSAIYVGTTKPTFVDSEIENNNLVIYPNPAGDYINISSFYPTLKRGVDECSDIQIYDMLGVIVLKVEQTSPSVQRIEISNLSPGMYFIKIGNRVEKFVKM